MSNLDLQRIKHTFEQKFSFAQSHHMIFGVFFLLLCSACEEEPKKSSQIVDTSTLMDLFVNVDQLTPSIDLNITPDSYILDQKLQEDLSVVDMQALASPTAYPTRIETYLTENRLDRFEGQAGMPLTISCEVYDQFEQIMPNLSTMAQIKIRPDEWQRIDAPSTHYIVQKAGEYEVNCELLTEGLRDNTPAIWQVSPNVPRYAQAILSDHQIQAGENLSLTCLLYDEFYNLTAAPTNEIHWILSPNIEQIVRLDNDLYLETAGQYEISCHTDSVTESTSESLEVLPASAYQILSAFDPPQSAYRIAEVIHWHVDVLDRFGNLIPNAPLAYDLPDGIRNFGDQRLLGQTAGRYQVSVSVADGIMRETPLIASAELLIDDGLPTLRCVSPSLSTMTRIQNTNIVANVADIAGLSELWIDDTLLTADEQGNFSKSVMPTWGLNLHQIRAIDALGNESSTFCAYFAADSYLAEGTKLNDAVQLHLDDSAIDDGSPYQPIHSITDILRAMINSQGIISTVDSALRAMNPLYNQCIVSTIFGCATRANVNYTNMTLTGPNTVTTTLLDGGLRINVQLNNLRIFARVQGSLVGIGINETGDIFTDRISIGISFNIRLVNGQPSVTVNGQPSVTVGNISINFDSAILGTIFEVISNLFTGLIRDQITATLKTYLSTETDSILTNVLNSLDLSGIGLNLNLPNPATGGQINLNLAFALNRLETSAQRMRIGLSSQVTGSRAQNRPSAGIALPPQPALVDLVPGANKNVVGAAYSGFLNTCLHQIWRSGLFEVSENSAVLQGLVQSGARLSFAVLVPPALEFLPSVGGQIRARIHLGPANGSFFYPGYLETSLNARFAMTILANVSIQADQILRFDGLTIENFHFALDQFALSEQSRLVIEEDLKGVMQTLVDTALNDALPSFPIPEFALPSSLSTIGIPRNTRLGVKQVVLERNGGHLQLRGVFLP